MHIYLPCWPKQFFITSPDENVAVGKPTVMPFLVRPNRLPTNALNANFTQWNDPFKWCSRTQNEYDNWWYVDLLQNFKIEMIRLYHGLDYTGIYYLFYYYCPLFLVARIQILAAFLAFKDLNTRYNETANAFVQNPFRERKVTHNLKWELSILLVIENCLNGWPWNISKFYFSIRWVFMKNISLPPLMVIC